MRRTTYAARFCPQPWIDIATSRAPASWRWEGCVAVCFASSDELMASPGGAGDAGRLDAGGMLDDDYAEGPKSTFADIANAAGRAGGSITAAKFRKGLWRFRGAPGHRRNRLERRHRQRVPRAPRRVAAVPPAGHIGAPARRKTAAARRAMRIGRHQQVVGRITSRFQCPDKLAHVCRLARKATRHDMRVR